MVPFHWFTIAASERYVDATAPIYCVGSSRSVPICGRAIVTSGVDCDLR
jgi:hypothetical protein